MAQDVRLPVVGYSRHPLERPRCELVALGSTIREHAPAETGGIVCFRNGEPVLRADWELVLEPCDVVTFVDFPQGREAIRTLLTIAVVIAAIWFPEALPYVIAANAAYNFLVPPRQATFPEQAAPDPIYSASLNGNEARLDQPIWKNCGRVKITPPFACQPYLEFKLKNPNETSGESDQYFYALFSVGEGEHDLEKAFIGKTAITHFADLTVANYLAPGEQPSVVSANVVTSEEASAALDMPEGRYVGPYVACRPNDRVSAIGIDIMAPQGLGTGSGGALTVEWRVEVREINDLGGKAIGAWQVLGTESRSTSNNTPLRWSSKYTLSSPIRCEARVVRTNSKNTDSSARDGIAWIGLRGYKDTVATLNPDSAHYEVVMRASEQLSQGSQHDFSMVVRGKVRTWTPGGGWGAAVFTRNAAWWLADLWTNPVWGEGLDDDRVDLQGLYEWSLTLDERQDHFDFTFASSMDAWTAAQLIARSGRARAFRKNGVRTVVRDELVDLPVTAFTPRNTQPKSMTLQGKGALLEQPNGIVVQYRSLVTWDTELIECPCPGFSAIDPTSRYFDTDLDPMSNPVYITLDGITGSKHAEREGLYQAADMAYRRTTVAAVTEMEGAVVSFFDAVAWQPQTTGYGQSGDVAFWDEPTLTMGLTEAPDWSQAPLVLRLMRDDLTLTDPVTVSAGPTSFDVVLPEAPDFTIVVDRGTRERPKFLIGPADGSGDEIAKLTGVTDGGMTADGAQLYNIGGVIDDDRVHLADVFLLPGPGEIQDPIDDGSDVLDDDGGGTLVLAHLVDAVLQDGSALSGGGVSAGITLLTTGSLTADATAVWVRGAPGGGGPLANQWLQFPAEPATAALYEVRATDVYGGGYFKGSALDTWLPMSTTRQWYVDVLTPPLVPTGGSNNLYIEIRRIGSTAVEASATFTCVVDSEDFR